MKSEDHVQVLLAVKNGGKFLAEQLESLKNQETVKIHLIAGIAPSADDSLTILKDFSNSFEEFQIVHTGFGSAVRDFLHLICVANPNLPTAFCDQDDLWYPQKLDRSLSELRQLSGPAAVSVGWNRINAAGVLTGENFIPPNDISMESLLFQNQYIGSSILMNEQAFQECQKCLKNGEDKVLAHDWAALLLISSIGLVKGLNDILMSYRIHSSNTVGLPRILSRRWIVNRSRISWPQTVEGQLSLISVYVSNQSTHGKKALIKDSIAFLKGETCGSIRVLLYPKRFRSNLFDEILLRLGGSATIPIHLMKRIWFYVKENRPR
jgi:glycosyltransferase involved in cell wall biosynthesis